MVKKSLAAGIIALFIISAVSPMVIGYSIKTADEELTIFETVEKTIFVPSKGLLDHMWPMQGYNRLHVGRSPYSTASNLGIEKWRFAAGYWCDGSPVIDEDGTIYFGGGTGDPYLYAIYPNGTLKWKFEAESGIGEFGISPAIADDGTIYFSTKFGSYIQAVNPNGTEKWKHWTSQIETSITIDNEGVLYHGAGKNLEARYPNNGTVKWKYPTGGYIMSTPAVDDNGTIYFGSHNNYIHALYLNGTLKWKLKTGSWVHGSPTIGPDGTIYCGSDDLHLYALFPNNGTMKWRCKVGSMLASPSLDKEGNLYFGVWENKIYSVSPNGTIRWNFTIGDRDGVWGSTAAISDDGTVYIGVCKDIGMLGGGEIIALNSNGTVKWRKIISDSLACSSPVISEDGVVYICSSWSGWGPDAWGYLHAFGPVESNVPPETPSIDGPTEGKIKTQYKFKVSSNDADNNPVSYFIDWDDGTTTGWTRDYAPGITVKFYHTWKKQGNYTIKVKARDTFGEESDWAYLEVTMPKNQNMWFQWLDRFPLLQWLLGWLIW